MLKKVIMFVSACVLLSGNMRPMNDLQINAKYFKPEKIIGPLYRNIKHMQLFRASKVAMEKIAKIATNKNLKFSNMHEYILAQTSYDKINDFGTFTLISDVKSKPSIDSGKLIIIDPENGQKIFEIEGSELLTLPVIEDMENNLTYSNIFEQKIICSERLGNLRFITKFSQLKTYMSIDFVKKRVNKARKKGFPKHHIDNNNKEPINNPEYTIEYKNEKLALIKQKSNQDGKKIEPPKNYYINLAMTSPNKNTNKILIFFQKLNKNSSWKTPENNFTVYDLRTCKQILVLSDICKSLQNTDIYNIILSKHDDFVLVEYGSDKNKNTKIIFLYDLKKCVPILEKSFNKKMKLKFSNDESKIFVALGKKIYIYKNPAHHEDSKLFLAKSLLKKQLKDIKIVCEQDE